jgi:hypothetical protein
VLGKAVLIDIERRVVGVPQRKRDSVTIQIEHQRIDRCPPGRMTGHRLHGVPHQVFPGIEDAETARKVHDVGKTHFEIDDVDPGREIVATNGKIEIGYERLVSGPVHNDQIAVAVAAVSLTRYAVRIRTLRGVPVNAAGQLAAVHRHPIERTGIRDQHLPVVGNLDAILTAAGVDDRAGAAAEQLVIATAEIDGHPDARGPHGVIAGAGEDFEDTLPNIDLVVERGKDELFETVSQIDGVPVLTLRNVKSIETATVTLDLDSLTKLTIV